MAESLVLPDGKRAIIHFNEGFHKSAQRGLVRRHEIQQPSRRRSPLIGWSFRCCHPAEVLLQRFLPAVLEPYPLPQQPLIKRGRHAVKLREQHLCVTWTFESI